MKKLFVSVLAIAGLVACNNEETIAIQGNTPMEFGGSFVENATRAAVDPSTTTNTLDAFDVWAFMDQVQGTVLVDEDVTKSGSKWAYTNVQYWLPEHTYYFSALAPMNSDNWDLDTTDADIDGMGVVSFTNVDGSEDLIYATTSVNTAGMKVGDNMPAVKFAFNHMLSKVKFTFKNGFRTNNVSLIVKEIKMSAPAAGELTLADESWTVDGTTTLEFGDVEALTMGQNAEAAQERLSIPAAATQEYKVTFTVEMYMGEVLAYTFEKESTITGATFEKGKAYNFVAEINPENLNLTAIEFDVVVNDWVNQTINGGAIGSNWEVVSTIEALQAALDAATGNTSISLGANLTGNVTVPELKGATVSINGNGYTFDGTFALVGGSTYGQGTTVFENINFATTALNGYDAFIYCNEQNGNTRYPDNVVIKDCTFAGANELPVGAKFRSLNGTLLITNCKAENMHSLVQLTSCGEATVTIDGAVVENCKNGIGLGFTANAVIKNSTINAREYGVRADGCATTTDIINSTIEAKQPVIVRKVTADGYVLNVDDATVLTTAEAFQVIFTAKSDDVEYVIPTVGFTCNAPAELTVFPEDFAVVATVEDLKSAVNKAALVNFESAVNNGSNAITVQGNDVVLNMDGNKLTAGGNGTNNYAFHVYNSNVEVNDVNLDGAGFAVMQGSSVTINDGVIAAKPGKSGRNLFYVTGNSTVTVNEGTYTFDRTSCYFVYVEAGSTCYINGGHYEKPLANNASKDSFVSLASEGTVIITGGTFNVNPTQWLADGYKATKSGAIWTVSAE